MKDRKLVISTGNEHKVHEIKEILKDLPIEVLSKKDLGLNDFEVVEDGVTFEDNSVKKAKALAEKVDFIVMADDSGLCVEVLNGDPGVYSSRYCGEEGNDKKNNIKLLENLKDIPLEKRQASFISVITLINENKEIFTITGECKGIIAYEEKGANGFGYDPLFIPHGYNNTFGELGEEIKNTISHRAKALEGMKEVLEKILGVKLV